MAVKLLVLDSWPIMECLKAREPVATNFDELIDAARTGKVQLLLSNINFGEIYYNCWKEWGQVRADEIRVSFDELPVRIVHPAPEDVLATASIKARYGFPYADSFAVVLALEYSGSVLTGDPDFLTFSQNGLVTVEWWGK
jgi:predicted nucleic acid-binding protein